MRLGVVPLVISSKIYLITVRQWYNLKNKGANKRESTWRGSILFYEIVQRGDLAIEQILSTVPNLFLRLIRVCWDITLKNKIRCNKGRLELPFVIHFCIDIDLIIQTYITYIEHDLSALGVT